MEVDTKREAFRIAGYVMLGFAVSVAVITFHLTAEGNRKLEEAENALSSKDRTLAIEALSDAASAYVPGARHVRAAHRDLEIMARSAEIRGDNALALMAWDALRRSILSVRHVFQPFGDALEKAEKSIVRIRNKEPLAVSPEILVQRPKDPSAVLSVCLFIGLAMWILGAGLWVKSSRATGSSPSRSRFYAAICVLGLVSWLVFAFVIG